MTDISIDKCDVIGTGGMSVVYKLNDALAVKVFRQGITHIDVLHEYDMAHRAYAFGMPTPQPHEIVSVGSQYAIIYDLLQGDTLSQAITEHPDYLPAYAKEMSELYKKLHSVTVEHTNQIPNAHKSIEDAIRRVTPIFGNDGADKLLTILHSIPQGNNLIHCDLHPRNIMIHHGKMMIIDMGEVGYGNPFIEIANVHALMTSGLVDVKHFMGFPDRYAQPLWDMVLHHYYHNQSPSELAATRCNLDIACLIRCFTWLAVSDGLPQEVITRFQGHFQRCVTDRWEIIKEHLDAHRASTTQKS